MVINNYELFVILHKSQLIVYSVGDTGNCSCMKEISSTPPVHLQYTSSTPPVHLQYTSSTPPVHLQYTSSTPPVHLQYTSSTPPVSYIDSYLHVSHILALFPTCQLSVLLTVSLPGFFPHSARSFNSCQNVLHMQPEPLLAIDLPPELFWPLTFHMQPEPLLAIDLPVRNIGRLSVKQRSNRQCGHGDCCPAAVVSLYG